MLYNVVEHSNRIDLIQSVLQFVDDGWVPIGGVSVSGGMFYQAMTCSNEVAALKAKAFKSYEG